MGGTSDWLYTLLLNRARETFAEAICAATQRSEEPPAMLLATEHRRWHRELATPSGNPVRIWSSTDDFSSLADLSIWKLPETKHPNGNRRVYPIPIFSWFIADDRKTVLIARHLGPRYGNGGWWDIVGQGKEGKLVRSDGPSWTS